MLFQDLCVLNWHFCKVLLKAIYFSPSVPVDLRHKSFDIFMLHWHGLIRGGHLHVTRIKAFDQHKGSLDH